MQITLSLHVPWRHRGRGDIVPPIQATQFYPQRHANSSVNMLKKKPLFVNTSNVTIYLQCIIISILQTYTIYIPHLLQAYARALHTPQNNLPIVGLRHQGWIWRFSFSNTQAPSFHLSTLLQHLQSFLVSSKRYKKNSLVVTMHTSARNVFRKGLPTHKPSTFFTASLHEGSACPVNHTLQLLELTVDFLANRRYRHECGGLFLHWLLVGPFTQKTALYTICLCT
jgi:hypothetical protein